MIPYDIESSLDETVRRFKVARRLGIRSRYALLSAFWRRPYHIEVARRIHGVIPEKDVAADRWLKPRVQVQEHYFESLGIEGASYGFGSTEQLQDTHVY